MSLKAAALVQTHTNTQPVLAVNMPGQLSNNMLAG